MVEISFLRKLKQLQYFASRRNVKYHSSLSSGLWAGLSSLAHSTCLDCTVCVCDPVWYRTLRVNCWSHAQKPVWTLQKENDAMHKEVSTCIRCLDGWLVGWLVWKRLVGSLGGKLVRCLTLYVLHHTSCVALGWNACTADSAVLSTQSEGNESWLFILLSKTRNVFWTAGFSEQNSAIFCSVPTGMVFGV